MSFWPAWRGAKCIVFGWFTSGTSTRRDGIWHHPELDGGAAQCVESIRQEDEKIDTEKPTDAGLDACVVIDPFNNRGNGREFIRDLLQPGDTLGYCTINPIEVCTGMRPGEERVTDMFFEKLLCYEVVQGHRKACGFPSVPLVPGEDRHYHWWTQLLPRTAASGFRAWPKSRLKGGLQAGLPLRIAGST